MRQGSLESVDVSGEIVRIRPVRSADADVLFPLIHRRREVLDWLIWQGPATVEELRESYSRWRSSTELIDNYQFAIELRSTGLACGTMGLRFSGDPDEGNLGYWLGSPAWGKGAGTEAIFLTALIAYEHCNVRALTAEVFLGNTASCRVLEHNGFERQAETQFCELPANPGEMPERREEWIYRQTRDAFEKMRAARGTSVDANVRVRGA